jgi:hypothetical protein
MALKYKPAWMSYRQTFVPPENTFSLDSLPQTIDGVLIKGSFHSTIGETDGWLVVHPSQGLEIK